MPQANMARRTFNPAHVRHPSAGRSGTLKAVALAGVKIDGEVYEAKMAIEDVRPCAGCVAYSEGPLGPEWQEELCARLPCVPAVATGFKHIIFMKVVK